MIKKIFLPLVLLLTLFTNCDNDPCKDVTCDQGYCVNGTCECDTGYYGADCSKEKVPSQMTIKQIRVSNFPPTDDNQAGWDNDSGADLYPVILKGGTVTVYTSSIYYENAIPGIEYTFNESIELTMPDVKHSIHLYDYDIIGDNDYVYGFWFYPYTENNGFPTTLIFEDENCKIEIDVTYKFD